jgi:hypothetical protein
MASDYYETIVNKLRSCHCELDPQSTLSLSFCLATEPVVDDCYIISKYRKYILEYILEKSIIVVYTNLYIYFKEQMCRRDNTVWRRDDGRGQKG